jgi:hypothetical protein
MTSGYALATTYLPPRPTDTSRKYAKERWYKKDKTQRENPIGKA